MANMSAAIAYQSSIMDGLRAGWLEGPQRARAVSDLPHDQEEKENAEPEVEPAEPDQREEHGSRVHGGTAAGAGPEEAVHEPGLSAQLGGDPSCGVGDVRQRKRDHEDPQHEPMALEPSLPGEHHADRSEEHTS